MNKKVESENYFVDGMPNDEYHKPELGVSTSTLKLFMEDPSLVVWNSAAKKDPAKMQVVDFGTMFHTFFLEPERFNNEYKVLPEFNRRKPAEKQEELDLIEEWKSAGITPVTAEDIKKIHAMYDSAVAHPTVAQALTMGKEANRFAERSFFWTDDSTGLKCKCRPDLLVTDIEPDERPPFMMADTTVYDTLAVDIKTSGDLDRMQNDIERFQYYIQDGFYTRGIQKVTGGKVCFLFVFVSTSLSIGRYPVKTVLLKDTAKFDADRMIDEALSGYAQLAAGPEIGWCTAKSVDRPAWAIRADEANQSEWMS